MTKRNKNADKITNAFGDIINTALNGKGKLTKEDEERLEKSLGEGLEGVLGFLGEKIGVDIEAVKENDKMEKKVFSFIESVKGNENFVKGEKDTHKTIILNNKTTTVYGVKSLIKDSLNYRLNTIQNIINQTEFTGEGVVCVGDEKTCKKIKKILKAYIKDNKEHNLQCLKIKVLEL